MQIRFDVPADPELARGMSRSKNAYNTGTKWSVLGLTAFAVAAVGFGMFPPKDELSIEYGVISLVMALAWPLVVRGRRDRAAIASAKPRQMEIDDEGIREVTAGEWTHLRWPSIDRVIEHKGFLVVSALALPELVIPLACMLPADQDELRAFLSGRILLTTKG